MLLQTLFALVSILMQGPTRPNVVQSSSGFCSPNFANITGNVTVNCYGVDPRALRHLNAELRRKKLALADKVREANMWAARYKELEERLLAEGNESLLSKRAEEYLHRGDLEKAGAVLDELIALEEKKVDRTAADHFNRGLVYELQFRPQEALPHFALAYRYRPENCKFAEEYARVLVQQGDLQNAEPILATFVDRNRDLSNAEPKTFLCVNELRNDLGLLYQKTHRSDKAESIFQEILESFSQLTKKERDQYLPFVAVVQTNLGIVYTDIQRTDDAQSSFEQALGIVRQLANLYPTEYKPHLAETLVDLGIFYSRTNRTAQAEQASLEAVHIYQELAAANPGAYDLSYAIAELNLGSVYDHMQNFKDAESYYLNSIKTFQRLSKINPSPVDEHMATAMYNIANLYRETNRLAEARVAIQEALKIDRRRWSVNPAAVGDNLANAMLLAAALRQPDRVASCKITREALPFAQSEQVKERIAHLLTYCFPN
jgi:Tfp pilus assembly protein PilF